MNLSQATVVLRERSLFELADLSGRFVATIARPLVLTLSVLALLPVLALQLLAQSRLSAGMAWLLALLATWMLDGLFTAAYALLLLSRDTSGRDVRRVIGRRLRAYLTARAVALSVSVLPFYWHRVVYVAEVALLEGSGGGAAISRSFRLSRNDGGRAFRLLLSLWCARLACVAVGEVLGQGLVGFVLQLGEPFGSLLALGNSPYALLGLVAGTPFVAAMRFLAYVDARTRGDGWDLQVELMALGRRLRAPALAALAALFVVTAAANVRAEGVRTEPPDLEPLLREVAAAQDLCREGALPDEPMDRDACYLAERNEGRCPALLARCRRLPVAQPVVLESPTIPTVVDGAAAELASALVYIVLAVALLAVGIVVVKGILDSRGARPLDPQPRDMPSPTASVISGAALSRRSGELLELARSAVREGRAAEAVRLLHLALLHGLEERELVRLHPSFTSGDYLRQLRDDRAMARDVKGLLADVERVEFGSSDAEQVAPSLLSRVGPLVGRTLALLLISGWLGTLSGCSATGARGPDHDRGPDGFSLLKALLAKRGSNLQHFAGNLGELPESKVEAAILLDPSVDRARVDALLTYAEAGGVVVLPAWPAVREALGLKLGARCSKSSVSGARIPDFEIANPKTLEGKEYLQLLSCGNEGLILSEYRTRGRVIVLSDPRLISNASLLAGDNARVVSDLMSRDEIVLIDELSGAGAGSPFDTINRARFGPVMLHALCLLLLAVAWRGVPFGRLRSSVTGSRRAFAEHVRALGEAYEQAGATRFVLLQQATWTLERLRDRTHMAQDRGLSSLAQAVSHRTGEPESAVLQLLTKAQRVREDQAEPARPAEDLETFRRLEQLLGAMGGMP